MSARWSDETTRSISDVRGTIDDAATVVTAAAMNADCKVDGARHQVALVASGARRPATTTFVSRQRALDSTTVAAVAHAGRCRRLQPRSIKKLNVAANFAPRFGASSRLAAAAAAGRESTNGGE